MSIGHKSYNTQVFRLMVYRRALHPELFGLQARKIHRHGEYEVETWILTGGHVVRFQVNSHCITEAVVDSGDHLPETGLVHALPCLGEKDYEIDRHDSAGGLGYCTTIQTEFLTDNLYVTTFREMEDFAIETDAISHAWQDVDGSMNLSLLDIQKYKHEFYMQSYHLIGSSSLVLRTQSIFEAPRK